MQLDVFFRRLKEERERLGLNQEAFGAVGGVKKLAQFNYESGKRSPDADYLAAIAKIGVDVLYLITGQRMATTLDDEERVLVNYYRAAPEPIKKAAMGVLLSTQTVGNVQMNQGGNNTQNNLNSGNIQHIYGRKKKE
jgi:transcriptional regulator with XRE-family HTH domain